MVEYTLTKEQVDRASRRDGIAHPVIAVLEANEPQLAQLNTEYFALGNDVQGKQAYANSHYGFLADAIEDASEYSVGPLDLIAIWSKAMEVFPDGSPYQRYRLAGMIANTYSIQGKPELKGIPRYYLENKGQLPHALASDKEAMTYVISRLTDVDRSHKEILNYINGTYDSVVDLAKRDLAGDAKAREQLQRLEDHRTQHSSELLEELYENLGTHTTHLRNTLVRCLEE